MCQFLFFQLVLKAKKIEKFWCLENNIKQILNTLDTGDKKRQNIRKLLWLQCFLAINFIPISMYRCISYHPVYFHFKWCHICKEHALWDVLQSWVGWAREKFAKHSVIAKKLFFSCCYWLLWCPIGWNYYWSIAFQLKQLNDKAQVLRGRGECSAECCKKE